MLAESSVLEVYQWLAMAAYRATAAEPGRQGSFLGWAQAWKFMLGLVMFFISKTSRLVRPASYDEVRSEA